jgi:hypothetical protein
MFEVKTRLSLKISLYKLSIFFIKSSLFSHFTIIFKLKLHHLEKLEINHFQLFKGKLKVDNSKAGVFEKEVTR